MRKYVDFVEGTDSRAVAGASVLVSTYPGNVAATLYADEVGTPLANPVTTDTTGEYWFYAANGRYTLQISGAGLVEKVITDLAIYDPADGLTAATQAGDSATAAAGSASASAGSAASAAAHDLSAETHDLNAQTAKAAAQAAQTAAETARDAAQASGRIYATTAAGLAAVASGQYFWVVSASNAAVLDLYLNNAGSAVSQSKSIPSTAILSSDAAISNAIQVWQDSASVRGMELDSSGRLAVRDVLLSNARSLSDLATTVDSDIDAKQALLGLSARNLDALRAETQATPVAGADIFLTSRDGGNSYRLPILVRISKTQFLAFAVRKASSVDFSDADIVCRSVTVASDGTITMGSIVTVAAAAAGFHYELGSAVRLANGNIAVLATYIPSAATSHVPMKFISADNGATWDAGTDISSAFPGLGTTYTATPGQTTFAYTSFITVAGQVKVTVNGVLKTLTTDYTVTGVGSESGGTVVLNAGLAGGETVVVRWWNAVIFGPAKAIVKRRAPNIGRVVIPYWRSGTTYPTGTDDLWAGFLYSDDSLATVPTRGAETWLSRSNESSVVEDREGNLILLSRREQQAGRWASVSKDGGAHISESYQLDQTTINAPVCEASVTFTDNDFDYSPARIVYAGPRADVAAGNTPSGTWRVNPTLFVTYGVGRSSGLVFTYRYTLNTGACEYTSVEACGSGSLLLIWESAAGSARNKISAQVVTMKQILGV